MICLVNEALTPDSTIAEARGRFARTPYYSLPVINEDHILKGAIRLKDILGAVSDAETIAPYITQDYIQIQRPAASQDVLQTYYDDLDRHTELFVTDFDGRVVDIITVPAFIKGKLQNNESMSEEQFLKQILRPTSLARCILDDLNDAVILVDKNSQILYANKAYGDILGVSVKKITGRYLSKIEPEARILDVLKKAEPIKGKIIKIKSLGTLIMANITPIKFQNNVVGAISVFSDITTITNIATDLEKMNLINNILSGEINKEQAFPASFKKIVGTSFKLRKQLSFATKVAAIESPVLILGESGTGKELLAQAIHEASSRKAQPFISINCAAIPENLLESELFGYEEGAFTGAKKGGKIGKFEQADGGTLFLDEIGDMPLAMQTKLLRFLQDKEIHRVGGTKAIKTDIRLISATNRPLHKMVEENAFREELFYRINVFTINLPPLRERKIDILNLIENYKKDYEEIYKKQVDFSPECIRFLLNYHWPGNVRELKNVIEHLIVMSNDVVTMAKLPEYLKKTTTDVHEANSIEDHVQPLSGKVKEAEKKAFLDALSDTNNNRTAAMKKLGISRRTFYKKLKELNL